MEKAFDRFYIDSNSPLANFRVSELLYDYLTSTCKYYEDIIVLCIGTDRSTGDSLGPLVGHKLEPYISKYPDTYLLGTLDKPVHAKNLQETIKQMKRYHPHAYVLAVDASLGKISSIGQIIIKNGPLKPGLGVHKSLPSIGDLSITGVVNMGGLMEYMVLQNTRLSLVMEMADTIARGINQSLYNYHKDIKDQKIK